MAMKHLSTSLLFCGLAALSFAGSLKTEIEAMNAKVTQALMKKDLTTFEKVVRGGVTKDFKHIENGQTQSFDEMLVGMKQGMAMCKKMKQCTAKLVSLKESGNTALAITRHSMTAIIVGEDKKDHVMAFTGDSRDTYRKVGGKWKLASMEWTNMKTTMDGKPFDMSKMAPPKK